jgi:hypothetical protein
MPYPINNRSDSLELDFHAIRRQVGRFLGHGYSHEEWDDEMAEEVQDVIDEGVRQAYFPPTLPNSITVHEWTFMRPTLQFSTVADQRRYQLPDDFERPHDRIAFLETDNHYPSVEFTSASRLRNLESQTDFTSFPTHAAIEPDDSAGDSPQRSILVLHPTPDGAYKLALEYQARARRLTDDAPYPLGGQAFGPVIMASCLAAAETFATRQQGAMYERFLQKLAGAISRDQYRSPHNLGYNGDLSTNVYGRSALRRLNAIFMDDATYNDVEYSG